MRRKRPSPRRLALAELSCLKLYHPFCDICDISRPLSPLKGATCAEGNFRASRLSERSGGRKRFCFLQRTAEPTTLHFHLPPAGSDDQRVRRGQGEKGGKRRTLHFLLRFDPFPLPIFSRALVAALREKDEARWIEERRKGREAYTCCAS